jgi:ribosomal protein S18 acetylase RimI-like enzyme
MDNSQITKHKLDIISEKSETDRLLIKDSELSECEVLQKINESSDYIEEWVGWKTPEDYASKLLTEGNLPPGGKMERYRAKSIYLKQTSKIIGVLEVYHGFPSEEVLCIGWLFIHPDFQRNGYANEVLGLINNEAKKANYMRVRIGVSLKNWPAIRFWHINGFSRVVDIIGDEVYSNNTFASIILEKEL